MSESEEETMLPTTPRPCSEHSGFQCLLAATLWQMVPDVGSVLPGTVLSAGTHSSTAERNSIFVRTQHVSTSTGKTS